MVNNLELNEHITSEVVCKYISVKSKKGYRGYWKSCYTVSDVIEVSSEYRIADKLELMDVNAFKKQGFKNGDIIVFKCRVTKIADGYKLNYIKDAKKLDLGID